MSEFILAQNELDTLFEAIKQKLNLNKNANEILLLRGDLASGKTTLVKNLALNLGFLGEVNSPTFSIMQKYEARELDIFHYDIYQNGFESLLKNGLFENFFENGLHIVEWGDEKLEKALLKMGLKAVIIEISVIKNKRKYVINE